MTTTQQALATLLDQFPLLPTPELDSEDLEDPYLVFGPMGLAGWVDNLLHDFTADETLKRVFALVERLLNEGTRDVRSLIAVAFLEPLTKPREDDDTSLLLRAAHYMGPKTAYLMGEVQAFWTGTLDAFHETTENPWADDDLLPVIN